MWADKLRYKRHLLREYKKPDAGDFTLWEFNEKVIQYGYLMIFASAFPLAPLLAIIVNLSDLRVDAKRLLWLNRRPIPNRAQDIGMWFTILHFLNFIGVLTNAFLVGLTSKYGREYAYESVQVTSGFTAPLVWLDTSGSLNDTGAAASVTPTTGAMTQVPQQQHYQQVHVWKNLWIVIIFQNAVLALKMLLAWIIPDVPGAIASAIIKVGLKRFRFVGATLPQDCAPEAHCSADFYPINLSRIAVVCNSGFDCLLVLDYCPLDQHMHYRHFMSDCPSIFIP